MHIHQRDKLARLNIGDGAELEQVLFAGFKALKWKLPTTAAGEAIDAIVAAIEAGPSAIIIRKLSIGERDRLLAAVNVDLPLPMARS